MIPLNQFVETIIGEGPRAGTPCVLIRIAGCNLDCEWCDTLDKNVIQEYVAPSELARRAVSTRRQWALITGGEPLLCESTPELAQIILDSRMKVVVETNGSFPLDSLPKAVEKSVDIKTPSSGCAGTFLETNLKLLNWKDSIRFVIANQKDFDWSLDEIVRLNLINVTDVYFSPVWGRMSPTELMVWILDSHLPVKLSLQMHKIMGVD